MVTTTTSPPCFSLRRRASSTAISSNGLSTHFTPSFTYPDPSPATRSLISGSGTRFAVQRIFTFRTFLLGDLEARLIAMGPDPVKATPCVKKGSNGAHLCSPQVGPWSAMNAMTALLDWRCVLDILHDVTP